MVSRLPFTLLSDLPLIFVFLLLIVRATSTSATSLNYTIDDTLGDAFTGRKILYDSSWVSSDECGSSMSFQPITACGLLFDGSSATNATWHAVLGKGSLSILFNGSSIYTNFIVPSLLSTSIGTTPTQVGSNLSFVLDGQLVAQNLFQVNRYGMVKYHFPMYRNTSMSMGFHNLTVLNGENVFDGPVVLQSAAVFDFAVYTVEEKNNQILHSGIIVMAIIVCVIMLCLMLLGGLFLRLRVRRRRLEDKIDRWEDPLPRLTVISARNTASVGGRRGSCHKGVANDAPGVQRSFGWHDTLQPVEANIPFSSAQLRRGSTSRLEAGVRLSPNTRSSLMVGVEDVLRRNAVDSRDAGFLRRRSTLSRLGIPLGDESGGVGGDRGTHLSVIRRLEPLDETGHSSDSPIYSMPRRSTIGHRQDSVRAEAGSQFGPEYSLGIHMQAQDDRALLMRLQAEIRMLRSERESQLESAQFGLKFSSRESARARNAQNFGHGDEPPDYDSIA